MGSQARRMMADRTPGERLDHGFELLDEEIQRVADQLEDLPEDPEARAFRIFQALRSGEGA